MHRFYLAPERWNAGALILTGPEAHHCRNVLRLDCGDKVVVFDGRGRELTGEIVSADSTDIQLRKIHQAQTPPLRCQITLGQAIPKGKNMDLIVQKAVEIGAAEIAPITSDRTVVRLDEESAASKQAGQNWLPQVHVPQTMSQFFQHPRRFDLQLIGSLQSDAVHLKKILAEYFAEHGDRPSTVLMLVGPEGDFTPAELSLARSHGCRPITLGPIVLRVETASIYCLSILSYELLV